MSVDKASRAARAEGILLMGKKFQELKETQERKSQPSEGTSSHFLFTGESAPSQKSPSDKPVAPAEFKKHIQDTFLNAYQHRQNHQS